MSDDRKSNLLNSSLKECPCISRLRRSEIVPYFDESVRLRILLSLNVCVVVLNVDVGRAAQLLSSSVTGALYKHT